MCERALAKKDLKDSATTTIQLEYRAHHFALSCVFVSAAYFFIFFHSASFMSIVSGTLMILYPPQPIDIEDIIFLKTHRAELDA